MVAVADRPEVGHLGLDLVAEDPEVVAVAAGVQVEAVAVVVVEVAAVAAAGKLPRLLDLGLRPRSL